MSLFPSTVIFPGIADRLTLETLQRLAGRELVESPTVHRDRRGRTQSLSAGWVERDRLSASDVARGRPGHALALTSTKELRWVALTPYFRDPRFAPYRERSAGARTLER